MTDEKIKIDTDEIKKNLEDILKEQKLIVCFTGPKQAGKTTACKLLAEKFEAPVLAFAEELKRLVMISFDLSVDEMGVNKEKKFEGPVFFKEKQLRRIMEMIEHKMDDVKPDHSFRWRKVAANQWVGKQFETPRQILQWVGTEFMHTVVPTFHCDVMAAKMKSPGLYFIDDLRFVSEWDFLKGLSPLVKVIRITGRNESEKGKEEHSSEADWKNIEEQYKISNTGTLPAYEDKIQSLFKKVTNDINKDIKEGNIELAQTVDNIIGESNASTDTGIQEKSESGLVKVGKFLFKKIKGN